MERGKFSLDDLFDRADTWCVANLPVEPVQLGVHKREVVAVDSSTIARWRATARTALAFTAPPDVVGRYDSAGPPGIREPGMLGRLGRADRAGIEEAQRAGGVRTGRKRGSPKRLLEIYRGVKHHHLFAKTKAEKQQVLTGLVAHSEALSGWPRRSAQVSTQLRAGQTTCRCHLAAAGRGGPHLAATDPAMAEDGESGDREDYSPGDFGRAGDPQRPRPS